MRLLLGVTVFLLCARATLACGYHPGLANATLDAVHPKSLSVALAIRRAMDRGVLEDRPDKASLPTFAGVGYRRAVSQLRELEERLARVAADMENGERWRFAFVFVRSRLWAEYTVQHNGVSSAIHTPPTKNGETVVLSDETVLAAIADGRLTFDLAVEQGLVVFDSDRGGATRSAFRAALGSDVGGP